ncbi:MAG: hypothetical protein ACTSPB_04145 [Candidatus Thorarchaeota archaeon]
MVTLNMKRYRMLHKKAMQVDEQPYIPFRKWLRQAAKNKDINVIGVTGKVQQILTPPKKGKK